MTKISELLKKTPKLQMTVAPTAIYKMENISKKYNANIYCMRDDLTGFAFGGNKTRKLDYLIADALRLGKDTIIGIGANQSNFCRMAAAAAKVNNMDAHLVLAGKKPDKPTGNLLIDHIFGATIHHVDTTKDDELLAFAANLEKELTASGKKTYNMPSGGSTSTGILGYVDAFDEIMAFSEKTNINFDKIFHASGSGGTQAGLTLGQQLYGWTGEIIGISVGRNKEELTEVINKLVDESKNKFGFKKQINCDIIVDDDYIGDCYGTRTSEGEKAIKEFAFLEGILLDFVYTGKGAAGMLEYVKTEKIKAKENILFIHTGGNIELFE